MKRFLPIIFLLLLIPLAGCKPAGKALASLQYHNINLQMVRTTMEITLGDGSIDLRRLMDDETYVGRIVNGHVTVEYPEGMEDNAKELARQFDDFYPEIKRQLGIEWSFDLIIKLVRVPPDGTGYKYSTRINRNRVLTFPVPVNGKIERYSVPVVAHEMTEASMISPMNRSGLVLTDLYSGSFCIPTGTRWFRDGVSDYASSLFSGRPLPGSAYRELNQVRERLLSWANCPDDPDWYAASSALIADFNYRFGEDVISRIMTELSKESTRGGGGLARAFKRATGTDLEEFLKTYETPWTGIIAVNHQGSVRVASIYPATPASRRGIKPGDVIVSFAEKKIASADEFAADIARRRPGEMIPITIKRGEELLPMRLKLIPMPVDIEQFLRLSG